MQIKKRQTGSAYRPRGERAAGSAVSVLIHAGLAVALFQYQPSPSAMTAPPPIMVELVAAAPPQEKAAPQPKPQPRPKPRPQPVKRPLAPPAPRETPPSVLAAPEQAPASHAVAAAPAAQAEPPASPAASAPVAVPAPAPTPVVPPSFNADYLQNPAPAYPAMARRMGQQGKVVLRVLVNTGGNAAELEVRRSSGSNLLDDAALEAVKRWRFLPARQGGEPVSAWVLIPITFTLQG